MKSEILTLSEDEIEEIKEKLNSCVDCSFKSNLKINYQNTKKIKNAFLVTYKKTWTVELKINLEKLSSLSDKNFQIRFENFYIQFVNESEKKIIIKQNLYFLNCKFKAIKLKNICFEIFNISECGQVKELFEFDACKFKKLYLNSSIFLERIDFSNGTKIGYLLINKSEFKKDFWIQDSFIEKIILSKNQFEDKCFFINSQFGNKDNNNNDKKFANRKFFSFVYFKDSVFFDESIFYDYINLVSVEFEKIVSFYGVTFYRIPNFYQVILKENLNAVNTNLNFDFEDLEKKINQECEEFNKNKKEQDKKSLDKFANDFRDSFRVFKNALIKDNNLLDASNFHKCELYCKEIELNSKKPKKFSKEWLDKYQLMFYRNLCDHHTDLILNLRWLIAIVGLFASILFVLRYGNGNLSEFFNKDNDLLKVLKNILNVKALNDSNAVYLIFMYSVIGLLFVRTFFILYYAVICFFYITISPFNLFQIASFTFKSRQAWLENITIFLYIFCISLVVFSLQKTARKNSIVPS
ncbi:hypothetical protein [Campylobacter molothri]|uniref:hypothetical protein n=1 Tax=Campylobacter molothri TaxID=1032242 RepID=UPI001DFB9C89|nr:hypothetical protein [Campylobacter sp. RM12397]MBZ7968358.1 hypothetical protein [Campylobacter sp. RM9759]